MDNVDYYGEIYNELINYAKQFFNEYKENFKFKFYSFEKFVTKQKRFNRKYNYFYFDIFISKDNTNIKELGEMLILIGDFILNAKKVFNNIHVESSLDTILNKYKNSDYRASLSVDNLLNIRIKFIPYDLAAKRLLGDLIG